MIWILADKTWSFNASSNDLDQSIKAGDTEVRVQLGVNGSYLFTTWLKHDIDVTWNDEEKKSAWQPSGVHQISGAYNSQTGIGHVELEGHIPKKPGGYGDVRIFLNGASVSIPLLPTDGFLHKFERAGIARYKADGLSYEIDFGAGRWKASIEGNQFKSDMAPKGGAMRVQVLVGGASTSDQTLVLQQYITRMHQENH